MHVWCDCCLVIGVEHGHAEGGLEFMESMRALYFLSFCGWSVRAGLIGTPFPVILCDFGKNRRFPGFGSVGGREILTIMHGLVRILPMSGRSV